MIALNGIKFGILLAFLVGPVFFTILQTSIERGFPRGVLVALGVSISDTVFVTVCYMGLAQVLEEKSVHYHMAIAGGTILILFGLYYLLIKSRKGAKDGVKPVEGNGVFRYIAKGFLINGFSPMVPVFWIGTISIATLDFGYTGRTEAFVFFVCMLSTVFIADVLKAYLAGKLRNLVTPRSLRIMNVVMGIVLFVFGLRLIMIADTFG